MSAALMLPVVWSGRADAHTAGTPAEAPKKGAARWGEETEDPGVELAFYRKHTEHLLRRYMHLSMQMGRSPSLLGNWAFRGRVSSYRMKSFEDAVIFVFDVEKCLKVLEPFHQELIARIALQEYTQGEAAALMGWSIRSVVRKYGEALDRLTAVFLSVDLLSVPGFRGCQERRGAAGGAKALK